MIVFMENTCVKKRGEKVENSLSVEINMQISITTIKPKSSPRGKE